MPFLLKHHFDPNLDQASLKPEEQDDGSVDHYELNFVQNVEAGSVIAEWVELDGTDGETDHRFISMDKVFPAGKGTGIKKKEPNNLYAAVSGCVSYLDDKIVVKQTLELPDDVDFHTGNINFIGDLTVGGSVKSGFVVQGRNVTILGQVEGARVEALQDLSCPGGIKGAKEGFVEAGRSVKLAFCEFALLKAGSDILVKGSLMHSDVYAGERLAVGGRLTGGTIYCHEYVYVGEQLGGGLGTDTTLVLGYDPTLLYADAQYNRRIRKLHADIGLFEKLLDKNDEHVEEFTQKLEASNRELELVKLLKFKLWEGLQESERVENCKVLVPGKVNPGVEISIGSAYLKVDDFLEDVYFYYENGEVKIGTSVKKIKR